MPYKIPGVPGSWYAPGTRNGNATIAWRGRLPDGTWTEFFTDATTNAGAQAFLRRFLERWHRDRPPPAGATDVTLAAVAGHGECCLLGEPHRLMPIGPARRPCRRGRR